MLDIFWYIFKIAFYCTLVYTFFYLLIKKSYKFSLFFGFFLILSIILVSFIVSNNHIESWPILTIFLSILPIICFLFSLIKYIIWKKNIHNIPD